MPALSTATLTAFCMLAHSFVGCCWHHGHPHAAHERAAPEHHRADTLTASVSPGGDSAADSDCQEGPCTYLKVKRTSLDLAATSSLASGTALVAAGADGVAIASRAAADPLGDDPAEPLRARISVWLL